MSQRILLVLLLAVLITCQDHLLSDKPSARHPVKKNNHSPESVESKDAEVDASKSQTIEKAQESDQPPRPPLDKKNHESITYAIVAIIILLVFIAIKKYFTSEDMTAHLGQKYNEPPIIIEQQFDPRLKAPYSEVDKKVIVQKFLVSPHPESLTNSNHGCNVIA